MAFDKERILALLEENNIEYFVVEHRRIYSMAELSSLNLPEEDNVAKTLFIRDDKKSAYYLAVIESDKKIDMKALRRNLNSRPLTFASDEDLYRLLGVKRGSVSPFCVLNDLSKEVRLIIDKAFESRRIGVHPNDNSATVFIRAADLSELLKKHGYTVSFMSFI